MIIESLLDTDLYKFTMMQAVFHQFPHAVVEYRFRQRASNPIAYPSVAAIRREIAALCGLRVRPDEREYLHSLPWLQRDFTDFLASFQLSERHINVDTSDGELQIVIRGPWLRTILFEVPVLAILSELHARAAHSATDAAVEGSARLERRINRIRSLADPSGFHFAEFGTRRRYSRAWQEHVVDRLAVALPDNFTGTSNVWFAMRHGLAPVGTMGHEFLQACQALAPRLIDSQRFALAAWAREYHGHLGIVLTDVIGLDAFLHDFDAGFARLFTGLRHDSGDPIHWGEQILAHYRRMHIDPMAKTLVFSDGLDLTTAIRIYRHFHGQTRVAFGIGTRLTNDCGVPPPDTVIKMTRCNGQAVAKISDDPGKTLCTDADYLARLKRIFAAPTRRG